MDAHPFPGPDVLNAPADVPPGDPGDVVTPFTVRAWADAYLPPDGPAQAFTAWAMDTFSDWADGSDLTVGALLADMLAHWTGRDGYPLPGPDGTPAP